MTKPTSPPINNESINIVELARRELRLEKLRKQIDREKARLKLPWWKRIFPWFIDINIIKGKMA